MTFCVVEFPIFIDDGGVRIFRTDHEDKHAEDYLIEELSKHELFYTPVTLTVYSSYTPCSRCSKKIKKFIELEHPSIEIRFVTSSLYTSVRPSCKVVPWAYPADCRKYEEDSEKQGLTVFNNKLPQLQLRAFNQHDWQVGLPHLLKKDFTSSELQTITDENYLDTNQFPSRSQLDMCTDYDIKVCTSIQSDDKLTVMANSLRSSLQR